MQRTKRAYTDEAKQQREERIIAAAEALLMERGYHAINMDEVARAAGLAKGTVYLYFRAKEELLLAVFERQAILWFNEIEQRLARPLPVASREVLADLLTETLAHKPLLTRLVALSPLLLEYNIALERAREHKLWIFSNLARIGELVDAQFNLRPAQGLQLLFRTFIIVAGLEGFAHPSPVMRQVFEQEPALTRIDFESELRSLLSGILKAEALN